MLKHENGKWTCPIRQHVSKCNLMKEGGVMIRKPGSLYEKKGQVHY